MAIVQEPPGAKLAPQAPLLVVWTKLPFVKLTEVIVSVPPPVLVRVTVWGAALAVPTTWLAEKVMLAGDRLTPGGVIPVPVKVTVCGLPAALSLTVSVPLATVAAVGEKVTLMVQEAPAANDEPQVLVLANGPVVLMPLIVRAEPPLFVKVATWAGLVEPTA